MQREKNKKLIIPKQVVTADKNGNILRNVAVEIEGDKIISVRRVNDSEIESFCGEILKNENLTLIPGFIQTHIHLCQTLFRGLADELDLLD